jgi:lipoprotein signal peptidase
MRQRASFAFLAIAASLALAADLGTKWWAEHALGEPREVVRGFVALAIAHNPGGAWSVLRDAPEAVRLPFFFSMTVVALGAIVWMYARTGPSQWAMRLGIPLVVGGALGNLVDRVRYGHVVDFIEFHAQFRGELHRWPTFNVADVAIVLGIALVLWGRGQPRVPRIA